MTDLSSFSIEIFREEQKQKASDVHKDADLFQMLCFDLLEDALSKRGIRLTPFKTEGPDGAIDHSGIDINNNIVICECKKNEKPENAETELKKLARKLSERLPTESGKGDLYNSWRKSSFKEYIYCTSCTLDPDAVYNNFKGKVEDMLSDLSKNEGLKHLADVTVTLYAWNNLRHILENNKYLFHKWIRDDRITGVRYFKRTEKDRKLKYRDYLYGDTLEYVSRDEFKKNQENAGAMVGESAIIDGLLNTDTYEGCVIYGQGGTGKTRLMTELALRARDMGWIVFKIDNHLKDLHLLEPILAPGHKYLLVFDYIEEIRLFSDVMEGRLTEVAPGVEIKVLGNCRITHYKAAGLGDFDDFMMVEVGNPEDPLETEFKKYMTTEILGEELGAYFKVDKRFSLLRPAFAVFLRFLHDKHGELDKDLDLRETGAFRKWLKRRLFLTFLRHEGFRGLTDFKDLHRRAEIFYLFSLLPVRGRGAVDICDDYNDLIVPLTADGWFEEVEVPGSNGSELRVIHDAIADEMLMFRLEERNSSLTSLQAEVEKIFRLSFKYGVFEHCHRSFERIAYWRGWGKRKSVFYDVFSILIKEKKAECEEMEELIMTSLMDESSTVRLIVENLDFFKSHIINRSFAFILAYKMLHFAKRRRINISEGNNGAENAEKWGKLLETRNHIALLFDTWFAANRDFLNDNKVGIKLLSAYVLCFGSTVNLGSSNKPLRSFIIECLEQYPMEHEAPFLIKSWLDAGGELNIVKEPLKKLLRKIPENRKSNLVIESWLDAQQTTDMEQNELQGRIDTNTVLESWMDTFGDLNIFKAQDATEPFDFLTSTNTSSVLKSRLDAGGEVDIVMSYVKKWLENFSIAIDTSFVITSWLDAGGELDIVTESMANWLDKFPLEMETSFVITSWLDAGGELDIVHHHISPWLEKFPLEMEARFVIQSWLDAGGEKGIVKNSIEKWLKKFPKIIPTSRVIQSWLYAGGALDIIQEPMAKWLNTFMEVIDARLVISSWLDAGGERDIVVKPLIKWINKFPLELETSFVMSSWLDAGGGIDIVKEYIAPWLNEYPLEMETHFVIKSWLDAGGGIEIVKEYIAPWLKAFPDIKETSFVIHSWLKAKGDTDTVKPYIKPWLTTFPMDKDNTSFVLKAWLRAKGNPQEITPHIFQWLEKYQHTFEASYVIKAWLKNTKNLDAVRQYAHAWIKSFKDDKNADFVIKRFCNHPDIPDDLLETALHWCQRFARYNEVLGTLSRLTRFHMIDDRLAAQWLPDLLSFWIIHPILRNRDKGFIESIMYNISTNKEFSLTTPCRSLYKQWFLSPHSFHESSLLGSLHFLQDPQYAKIYHDLLQDGEIDIHQSKEPVRKYLNWLSKWYPQKKPEVQPDIDYLQAIVDLF